MRSAAEIVLAAIYTVGAIFNMVYTLGHSREFYGDFADGAWLRPARSFIDAVIVPNGVIFTIGLIVFQVAVAVAILTRGDAVRPALLIGGAFALAVAFFSSPGGTVGNLALAGAQFALAGTR